MATTIPTVAVNRPRDCKEAISRATGTIVIDVETTGIEKHDHLVSVGILVAGIIHILFYGSRHATVRNLPIERIRDALTPLADRADLVVVGHGFGFDLGHLRRLGIPIGCGIRDTEKLLRLIDQDRGRDGGDVKTARIDRLDPGGPSWMNCKLKTVVPQLLGMPMVDFPGATDLLDRARHVQYLSSDLIGTKALYDHLWARLSPQQRRYHDALVEPLTPRLDAMTAAGIAADTAFIAEEVARLEALKSRISGRHLRKHGSAITMDAGWLNGWLFRTLALKPKRYKRGKDRKYRPALDREHLTLLHDATDDDRTRRSLRMIRSYRRADSLIIRLRPLLGEVEADGRIRTTLNDRQATGRISSSRPNLQQVAKSATFAGQTFRPRNALAASPGFTLVSFDVKQADIRALAHAVESFPHSASKHIDKLRAERLLALGNQLDPYLKKLGDCFNPFMRPGPRTPTPEFYPFMPCRMADDFRAATAEFYETVAAGVLGRKPTEEERNAFKTITLGTINGQGVESLAKALKCDEASARAHLTAFESAYPTEMAFKGMIQEQIALTGSVESWAGRTRTNSAHHWMTSMAEVEILISYRRSDAYWLRVVPLDARRHVLIGWIKAAWDARPGPRRGVKIYSDTGGKLVDRPYVLFDQARLLYQLPARGIPWRNIRRVRTSSEEARYHGFDATERSLFNHICQAGTADMVKVMMLRSGPVAERFSARMLLQIHDELLFEVPSDRVDGFIPAMRAVLQLPPSPEWKVPILVDASRGQRFGDMVKVK